MELTAVSVFTGAGGIDIGFSKAGIKTIVANEINKNAFDTYKANHKNITYLDGDINNFMNEFSKFKGTDIVFGGPPCQGFSIAGKMDLNDPRSKLIFSFLAVVEKVQPRAFVMENVKSLATLEKFKEIREELIKKFKELEYETELIILNAKNFGVPQSRERMFLLGIKNGEGLIRKELFKKYELTTPTLRDTIIHLGVAGSNTNPNVCNAKITPAKNPVLRKSPYAGMLFNGQGRPINSDGLSTTLPASMGGNRTPIIDENHLFFNKKSWIEEYHQQLFSGCGIVKEVPKFLRRLTIDEASLIQTFPPDYIFKGSQSSIYNQIGNAVPPNLAFAVASVIKESLNKD